LSKRKSLSQNFIKEKALLLEEKISKNNFFNNKSIAFYSPINGELDPTFAMKNIAKQNSLSLPKITEVNRILKFIPFNFGDKLKNNPKIKHLLEPKEDEEIIPDIVLVPIVGVDKKNHRIGMGGGYYDSTISYYREHNFNTIFIGIAYKFQLLDNLIETSDHDQRLDKIITV